MVKLISIVFSDTFQKLLVKILSLLETLDFSKPWYFVTLLKNNFAIGLSVKELSRRIRVEA